MKLLLDAMFSPIVAAQLREREWDVIAVIADPQRYAARDVEVLAWALDEERALVTDDVADFMPIHAAYGSAGRTHAGLIFTSNRRFPRSQPSTLGALVTALDRFLRETAPALDRASGFVHWLR